MLDYEFITRADALGRIANDVVRAEVLGLDVETTALDPRDGEIRLLQLALPSPENSAPSIFVIDLWQTGGLGPLESAFRDTKAIFVIHNAKFEQKWLWHKRRLELWPVFCTFRASALLYNGKVELKHTLDDVIRRELQEEPDNVGQGGSDWSRPQLTQSQKDYAAEDVLRLLRLRDVLKQKLVQYGLLHPALIEFGVIFPEARTELSGFPLDRDKWTALADANRIEARKQREQVLVDFPHPRDQLALPGLVGSWNPDSPQQVLVSLRKLGLKIDGTAEMVLAQHAAKCPEVRQLLKYRGISQRVKSFGEKYLRWIRADTGRVHTEYYAMLDTGRYSSSKPNLQQIPRDPEFRACFTAPGGRTFIGADYAGIEMRICAEVSGDSALTKVFTSGEDAHYATAAVIMEKAISEVTKAERQNAKPVNFGFIYGMQPKKFVLYALANYGVTLTEREATRYHKRYFDRYEGVRRWHDRMIREGKRGGVSRTLSGRLRYLDPMQAFNEFYNTPIQGTGADALKTAMRLVQKRLDKTFGVSGPGQLDEVFITHHVHDEILLEGPKDPEVVKVAEKELHDGMYEGMAKFLTKVPVVVEPSHGPTWADVK